MSSTRSVVRSSELALDNQICFALYSTSLTMTKLYKPLLDSLALTYPQYLVMLVLWEGDGMSVKDLGTRLFLDSGTLTPLLKRLESQGLLERRRSAKDERQVLIFLTDGGRKLQAAARAFPEKIVCATTRPVQELIHLQQQLVGIRQALMTNR